MAKPKDSLELAVNETENIMHEYQERMRKALEAESSKLKEKAEEESSAVLEKARAEAERIIVEANKRAQTESERIIAEAKEQAEVITSKAQEEIRQETSRAISEAKEKASEIVADALKRGTIQAQCEFARVASEVGNKTYQLMNQISKSIEQVISETETNFKVELARISSAMTEEEPAPPPAVIQKPVEKAPVNSAPPVPTIEDMIIPPIAPAAPVTEKTEISYTTSTSIIEKRHISTIKEDDSSNLYKGRLKLEMVPPYAQERLEGVPPWLAKINGLRVVSTNCYAQANRWITAFTIDLDEPTPLLKTLKSVSQVKEITDNKGNIVVTLR